MKTKETSKRSGPGEARFFLDVLVKKITINQPNREVTKVVKTIVITAFFVLGMVAAAAAGDYHYGTTLICSDCHVMHFSQTHGYNNDGGGTFTPLGSTPEHHLLRDEVNKLCLNCHDGQAFAPDVYATNTGTHNRQA